MEKAIIITYNSTHLFQKPIPVWDPDYTTTFTTRFWPIPLLDYYNPTYIGPDYGRDPYWDTERYNQDLLQFQYVLDDIHHYKKSVHENPLITHNKKTRALIKIWQMNDGTNHPVFANPLGTENNENCSEPIPKSLLDETQFQNVLITKECDPDCIPKGIQSGSHSLVMSTFWNCVSSSSDCGIGSAQFCQPTLALSAKKTHALFTNGLIDGLDGLIDTGAPLWRK